MRHLSDIVLNQHPLTLTDTALVTDASRKMHEKQAGSVLVTNGDDQLVGIFTGRDAVHRVLATGKDAAITSLAEVMTKDPVSMSSDKSAIEALRLMWDGGFRHIPVVDSGRIVGVVSRGDFSSSEKDRIDEERELWEHMR